MNKSDKIYIAGHNGMVGSAIWRLLNSKGFTNLIGKSSNELDLRIQKDVESFFSKEKPEYVFLAAARVGGIIANDKFRAEFLYDNMMIQNNVIHQSYLHGVKKLLYLGSSCIYPKHSKQPMKEEYLLSGYLEPTNDAYAIAKISGIKMCENYRRQYGFDAISAMPTNLYGPGDNYHSEHSHVIPALIRKVHEAKERGDDEVTIWGTGAPLREFMHVDDLADACLFLMANYSNELFINVGTAEELSIFDLVSTIVKIAGFEGQIKKDESKPDGTPRKLMDSSRLLSMGWTRRISLFEGLTKTYNDFTTNSFKGKLVDIS